MTRSDPSLAPRRAVGTRERHVVDPSQPHDSCVRCGRPTPLGIALCDEHNPAGISGPSATQVHGTIFIGVVIGFVALGLLAQLLLGGFGPFDTAVLDARGTDAGGAELTVQVTNSGSRDARANCRVTRGGVSTGDDLVFQTAPIPAGQSVTLTRSVPPPAEGNPPWALDRFAVACS